MSRNVQKWQEGGNQLSSSRLINLCGQQYIVWDAKRNVTKKCGFKHILHVPISQPTLSARNLFEILTEIILANQEHNNVSFTELFYFSTVFTISYKGKIDCRERIRWSRSQVHHLYILATHARFYFFLNNQECHKLKEWECWSHI